MGVTVAFLPPPPPPPSGKVTLGDVMGRKVLNELMGGLFMAAAGKPRSKPSLTLDNASSFFVVGCLERGLGEAPIRQAGERERGPGRAAWVPWNLA